MRKVKEIMTTDVATIEGKATIADAISILQERKVRSLIVVPRNSEDAYGIITETDIAYKILAYGISPKEIKVKDIMTKPCIVLNPDLGIEYAARLFANTKIHRAPVIKDTLVGILSITDIIRAAEI